ncbi:MAG TPA: glycosyltransferase family 4 protein [Terriglobales bacterium]
MKRILHADFSRVWRGGQQQLLILARALAVNGHERNEARGFEQTIVARPGPVSDHFRAAGFRVLAPGHEAREAARVSDILHAHDGAAHSWIIFAGGYGKRVLSRRVPFPIAGWASRWKYRRMDAVLAVSEYVRQAVLAAGVEPARVRIIPDAVEPPEAEPAEPATKPRERLRKELGIAPDQPLLLCLSAFTAEKGVTDAVLALRHLPSGYQLALRGEGALRPQLELQARRSGVAERVRFVTTGSPAEWVAASDIVLMPSLEEGLGSAALLAMALERPVVATRVGGIPELVAHDVTGWLVDPGAPEALAAGCAQLWAAPALRARLVGAAAGRVRERHSPGALAQATIAAYTAITES